MVIMLENKINYVVYLASMMTVLAANELPVIGPDSIFWAFLGMLGSFAGSLVRIVKRDEADVEDKIKFFYFKDIFKILAWSLVGGFFPLVLAANNIYPWLAVLSSPFMPRVWDTMDEAVPGIIKGLLSKFSSPAGDGSNNKKETEKETDGKTK